MLYRITDGTLAAGGRDILRHFDFEIRGNEKAALIGPNGCGKTTLLRYINGEIELERDDRRKAPPLVTDGQIRIGMLRQQLPQHSDYSVREEIRRICPVKDTESRDYAAFAARYARYFMNMGFAEDELDRPLDEFSGGQRMRIELIRLIMENPDLMLLDEPTNNLDLDGIEYLEHFLRHWQGAAVIVSHDRYFLDRTVQIVYEITGGRLVRYTGGYTQFCRQKAENIRIQSRRYAQAEAERERLEKTAARFRGRSSKDSFARAKLKQAARIPKVERPETDDLPVKMGAIVPAGPGPKVVLECEKMTIGRDRALLQLSFRLRRGRKIGVIGANGTGKTTLLQTIMGELAPLSGKLRIGEHVQIGYFDQNSGALHSPLTVIEHFRQKYPGMREEEIRHYLARYRFRGADVYKQIEALSGGERARLVLAEILQAGPNLLILDEPTNHLDIRTREVLEAAFAAYQGTILAVSHDRYFIDKIADSLLVFENGAAYYYPFGYSHYMQRREASARFGKDLSLLVEAENQALIDGLRSVPEKSSLLGGRVSEEQLYEEWRLEPAAAQMHAAGEAYAKAEEEQEMRRRQQREEALRRFAGGEDAGEEEAAEKTEAEPAAEVSAAAEKPEAEPAAEVSAAAAKPEAEPAEDSAAAAKPETEPAAEVSAAAEKPEAENPAAAAFARYHEACRAWYAVWCDLHP